jgi:hypothetical protein
MLPHPTVQYLLARIGKCVATTASDAPQFDGELRAKQASQRSSESGSRSIAKVVCPYALSQRGPAGWLPI